MQAKMCDAKRQIIDFIPFYTTYGRSRYHNTARAIGKVKHKRFIRCGTCGRRLQAKRELSHDGDMVFVVPPHKIKGWWKKKVNSHG